MLVDDPVKRVDNMTMAWGLEARVPFLDHELVELAATCPPELKPAHGGKGVLKEAARQVIPAEVIDRPKGYFPVPALTHLEGPYLDRVRDALYAPAAKERGLFRPRRSTAAGRPERPADSAARQRAVADRAARDVAAAPRHHRSRGMTARRSRPDDHPEAITLGLHDASPQHMVDAMANDVVLELGWGRLIFGQTFADPGQAGRGAARRRRRAAATSASTPANPMCWSPGRPPNCSSTPVTPIGCGSSDDDADRPAPTGFTVRTLHDPPTPTR